MSGEKLVKLIEQGVQDLSENEIKTLSPGSIIQITMQLEQLTLLHHITQQNAMMSKLMFPEVPKEPAITEQG